MSFSVRLSVGVLTVCLLVIVLSLEAQTAMNVQTTEILARARQYAELRWTPTPQNVAAGCIPGYRSNFAPGVEQKGEPYRWGGSDTPAEFIAKLNRGLAAGAHAQHHENPRQPCTAGTDCSGFVCNVWNHAHLWTGDFGRITTVLPDVSSMHTGDAFLKKGSHVILFIDFREDGTLLLHEAAGARVHEVKGADWGYVQDYVPVRYINIQ